MRDIAIVAACLLLTAIIFGIILYAMSESRKISRALRRCEHEETTPLGWNEDGWVSTCDACGDWVYHGDDHDNPPAGFLPDGRRDPDYKIVLTAEDRATPAIRRARDKFADLEAPLVPPGITQRDWSDRGAIYESNPGDPYERFARGGLISCTCGHKGSFASGEHGPSCPMRTYRVGELPAFISRASRSPSPHASGALEPNSDARDQGANTITPYPNNCTCHPDDRPAICMQKFALQDCDAAFKEAYGVTNVIPIRSEVTSGACELCGGLLEHTADCPAGIVIDMLPDQPQKTHTPDELPPPPNMGGEGNPPYAGPHYSDVTLPSAVPYDMIGEPIPGAAVTLAEGEKGHDATFNRDDSDES